MLLNSKEVGTYTVRVINGDRHSGNINRDARLDYEDIDYGLSAIAGIRLKIAEKTCFVTQFGYNSGLYKYNLIGSSISYVHLGGFQSAHFLLGLDIELGRP